MRSCGFQVLERLAPNMWTLDFLICPTDLKVHPEWDGFAKYYTEGRWAVWCSNV